MFYQKISRDNDKNILLMVYAIKNDCVDLVSAVEVRTSLISNEEISLRQKGYSQIMSIHVSSMEYEDIKKMAQNILRYETE